MPEVESYKFSHKELVEALIKAAGVHEGDWALQVNFGFTAGNFGPDENNMMPGGAALINHIGITKAKPDSPKGLVVSAEKVNPSST
jgi:hypothetical protein